MGLELAGFIVGILGFAFSLWQYYRAEKAEKRLREALTQIPTQLVENISRLLQNPKPEFSGLYALQEQESEQEWHTSYADLDGDGKDELLVQYPYGAHGAVLQVFGFRKYEFKLIGEIMIDTMAGFLAQDVDNDGRIEIITHEVSPDLDFPYAAGFRDEVWYRLESEKLVAVKRVPLYTPERLKEALEDPVGWMDKYQK